MPRRKVAVLVGSLRKESFNRKMARALIELAPPGLAPEVVEIGRLPLYNPDEDEGGHPPAAWAEFRRRVGGADAPLFVTPEYNPSVPAVLHAARALAPRPT